MATGCWFCSKMTWCSSCFYLRFIHPWDIHAFLPIWAFKGVCRVEGYTVHGVVQCHIAWLLVVTLTDEVEGVVLQSYRWCPHVEEFSALCWQLFFHSPSDCRHHHVDKQETHLDPTGHRCKGSCWSYSSYISEMCLWSTASQALTLSL